MFFRSSGTPTVQEFVAIRAPREAVFALVRDQAQRGRFLPDGWALLRTLTEVTDQVGSQMELLWQVGPRPLSQVWEIIEITETQVREAPPAMGYYLMTWTVGEDADATLVGLHLRFDYGDIAGADVGLGIGAFFVKRRLHKAFRQLLDRLKAVAEGDSPHP